MNNRNTYELLNLDTGAKLVLDGTGRSVKPDVESSDKTWKRSTKDFAFSFDFSKDYKFHQNAAAFIKKAYDDRDIEANIQFTETRLNNQTDIPYTYVIGYLDFAQYSQDSTSVSIPIKNGGLKRLLTSQKRVKFELGRAESINGVPIDGLPTHSFAIANRGLPLNSKLETKEEDNASDAFRMKYSANHRYGLLPIPISTIYESDDSVITVPSGQFSSLEFKQVGSTIFQQGDFSGKRSFCFYFNADSNKVIDLSIKGSITADMLRNDDLERRTYSLRLVKFTGADDPVLNIAPLPSSELITAPWFPERDNLVTLIDMNSLDNGAKQTFVIDFEQKVQLNEGESLALCMFAGGYFEQYLGNAYLNIDLSNIECLIEIFEQSKRYDINRQSKCVLNKDVGNNLMQIITGENNRYYSEYYNSSEFKLLASTTGKWIRGFLDNKYTTSFNDFISNSKALLNMAYNIEVIGGKEVVVHEPLKHFFQQGTVLELPNQISDVKRTVAKEFIFSSISSGFKKPSGDNLYEEVSGLKEVNIINKYTAPITKISKEHLIESPYRMDSEGKELTARRSKLLFPTSDYRSDKHIFNLDLIDEGTNVYSERTWHKDYETAPYSDNADNPVFEADTLTGLRFTPSRMMQRHFWFLNNAYTKEIKNSIRYASTTGNSDFVTKKENEQRIAENGNHLISEIEPPIFVSQWIKCKHIVTDEIAAILDGTTNINGREIPNLYFKIGFINEFGQKEYGYLFELKPDKAGEWKFLKAL